jgi:hypothetical protein
VFIIISKPAALSLVGRVWVSWHTDAASNSYPVDDAPFVGQLFVVGEVVIGAAVLL